MDAKQIVDHVYKQQRAYASTIWECLFELYNDKLTTMEKLEKVTDILEKAVDVKGGGEHGTV